MAKFPATPNPLSRSISEQVFAAGIREALAAGDTAKVKRLQVLWRDYVEDIDVF